MERTNSQRAAKAGITVNGKRPPYWVTLEIRAADPEHAMRAAERAAHAASGRVITVERASQRPLASLIGRKVGK